MEGIRRRNDRGFSTLRKLWSLQWCNEQTSELFGSKDIQQYDERTMIKSSRQVLVDGVCFCLEMLSILHKMARKVIFNLLDLGHKLFIVGIQAGEQYSRIGWV